MAYSWQPLAQQHFELLLTAEHEVCPHDVPDTSNEKKLQRFAEWHADNRNLSQVCYQDEQIIGFISVIPVNLKGWQMINDRNEDLDEYALTQDALFSPGTDDAVGFHVYMIQKLDREIAHFTELAYKQVLRIFEEKKTLFGNPQILGLSGFSVSPEAIFIAFNRLNRSECKPSSDYMCINPQGELEVVPIKTQKEFNTMLTKGYTIRNRARLSAVQFSEPSIIWRWLEGIAAEAHL